MIICYEGKMGMGKSSLAVLEAKRLYEKRIREYKRGLKRYSRSSKGGYVKVPGLVYTNMRSLAFANRYIYSIQDLINIVNGVVLLDEGHIWFLSRDWRETGREIIAWFAQSRKRNIDVVYTVQHLSFIDSSIRRITDYVYRTVRIGGFVLLFRRQGFDLDSGKYKFAGIKRVKSAWSMYDHREVILEPYELYGGGYSYEEYKKFVDSVDYRDFIYKFVCANNTEDKSENSVSGGNRKSNRKVKLYKKK